MRNTYQPHCTYLEVSILYMKNKEVRERTIEIGLNDSDIKRYSRTKHFTIVLGECN